MQEFHCNIATARSGEEHPQRNMQAIADFQGTAIWTYSAMVMHQIQKGGLYSWKVHNYFLYLGTMAIFLIKPMFSFMELTSSSDGVMPWDHLV